MALSSEVMTTKDPKIEESAQSPQLRSALWLEAIHIASNVEEGAESKVLGAGFSGLTRRPY
jgi:hypothetical protein